jgi:selenocysteine lyase/cysteine desulfurase
MAPSTTSTCRVGRDAIHHRVDALTAWLLDELGALRHGDGTPLVHMLGPTTTARRGGTVAFMVREPGGRAIDGHVVESLANGYGISLRSGCFCNPGAAETALGIDSDVIAPWFDRGATYDELSDALRQRGQALAAVRVSFGVASDFADVHRLVGFLKGFVDRAHAAPAVVSPSAVVPSTFRLIVRRRSAHVVVVSRPVSGSKTSAMP